jgi:hypothetical protein
VADRDHRNERREPVGTVAEETARLVEAFGDWAQGLGADQPRPAAAPSPPTEDGGPAGEREAGTRHTQPCQHCGSVPRPGEAVVCQLCPLCQGISLLRAVRPETVERLADVAAALSGALRDIAAERFRQSPPGPPPRGQRVQDIDVDDEDDPRPGAASTGAGTTDTHPSSQESAAP